ncbi:hypothetical protein K456DRAFT_56360 [Colletotrichum gloeosporioides 23]|nr:hypothetical protein K456DRAFT_56360 [Colletotrichum gloeosporioides 23]
MTAKITDRFTFVPEFCLCATAISLFLMISSRNYRLKLWEKGGPEGWNSSPNQPVRCDQNCNQLHKVPLVWSQDLVDATLAVTILSAILMIVFGQFSQIFSLLYDDILAFFWLHSLSSQASPDLSDMQHPSPLPWYLTRQCPEDMATPWRVTQASFVISAFATLFYTARFIGMIVEVARVWRKTHGDDYQLITMQLDEERGMGREEAEARERERYLCREALSPVLAFFPEDAR